MFVFVLKLYQISERVIFMGKVVKFLVALILVISFSFPFGNGNAHAVSAPKGCKTVSKLSSAQVKKTFNNIDKHSTSRNAGYIITGAIASKIPYIGPPIAGVTTMAGFLDGMKYGMWANAAANNKKAILYHCKPKNPSETNGPIDHSGVKFY
jgi:hypothetical protein